jgi:hypothetical protein
MTAKTNNGNSRDDGYSRGNGYSRDNGNSGDTATANNDYDNSDTSAEAMTEVE